MKTSILASLSVLVLVSTAQARPHRHPTGPTVNPVEAETVLEPLRQAATACFADTVLSNPKATAEARAGRWYEAVGITGFLCRPEVAAMIQAHDRLYGPKTGERYFKGAYAKHLDQQLAERLQPMLAHKAVASAEPPADKGAEDTASGN
ncbi:hypothetical protein MKK69_07825 [Methylobacterium sp. J-026]|uniref:hypothetical protein n=1 Tax=Methylobacterium sp. J-026 TaxID=2836624 RepID=UPI001FBBE90C|nr:hypothetical protein [Methylobacterium sp. J-026]MCJ2133980.1 hypothetical protein [Methylobacterium sp. J-026]